MTESDTQPMSEKMARRSRSTPAAKDVAGDVTPLIMTKVSIPRRRDDLLPRRRLVDFVHAQLDRKLVLISAPAGFGKTSLLTDFAHDTDLPVCWYTLDSFDRDLRVFLDHLIAAIALRFPAFGQRSTALLRVTSDPGSNLYPIVATMVQEIYDTIPEYFFLVLDDHHSVEDQEPINEFLDLFVTYVDENCHLILASRTLPALPSLSLLVARRQAAGLSIDELRFTPREIQALVKQNYKLELSLEQASTLAERTGGWITGLLLTSAHRWERAHGEVAVRGRINIDLYDYLTTQVLDRQPAALHDFLLASSVLDELDPELCNAVLDVEQPSQMIGQLRTRNLFITEFEGSDDQIRYHDLFREFLQDSLRQRDEARFRRLTARAASAYAARGEWERAVSRYLALEQYEPVIQIVERTASELFVTGRWDTLASWIDALPEPERAAQPYFYVDRAKIHTERGDHDRALELFERAESAFLSVGNDAGRAYALVMKGNVLRYQGRYTQAIARCRESLALVNGSTEEEKVCMALAYRNAGLCHISQGQVAEGVRALEQALDLSQALEHRYDVGLIYHDLGWASELRGDLDAAVAHYQAALNRWQQIGNPAPWANTLNGLGVVYYLQGRYEQALQTLEEALAKSQTAGDLRVEAFVWASLGDVHRDLGAYERAKQAYDQALEVARRCHIGFIVSYTLNALGNTLRLQGDLAQAGKQLQQALEIAREHHSDYEIGLCHTSLGILATDRGDLTDARSHLDEAVQIFESSDLERDLAVAHLHRAQAAFLEDERQAALDDLRRTLDLVGQLGFDQFVVVEGQKLLGLFRYAQQEGEGDGTFADLFRRIKAHQAKVAARPEPTLQVEPTTALKIRALGQPQVELGGESVQWTTVQSRDLFFCLLQHPRGLRKEELGAIFWPDHPPRRLDGIFRSTLYRLRRALFRESVIFEDGLYSFAWETDYRFDVEDFEHLLDQAERAAVPEKEIELLSEALALYQGDYLDGTYADWCSLERERLRERCLGARQSLAELYAGVGNLNQAIEQYQYLVAQDPYREVAHRELMRWHYRLGDRVAAVRQYQSCVQILRDDLDLSPSPETEALYLKIVG